MKTAEEIAAEKAAADALKAKSVIASAIAESQAPLLKAINDQNAVIGALTAELKTFAGAVATSSQQKATNNMGDPSDAGRPSITGGDSVQVDKGIRFVRVLKAVLTGRMTGSSAEDVLKGWGYEEERNKIMKLKALSQGVLADGGALVPNEYSADLIALLRNATAVRKLGARVFPMGASIEMPSQSSAASAQYVGENTTITPSQPALGGIRLSEKKLAALVAISNDLIRNAVISAEQFVRDDLVQVIALKEDYQALFGVGSEYSPRGIVSLMDTTNNAYNATAASQVAPTLAELRRELAKAKRKLKSGNIPMTSLGWIISPRTEEYLYAVTDGNGNAVFQAALDAGRLMGSPLIVTNQIPENLTWSVDGSADVSRIFFGDFAQFMIGESMQQQVEVFPNATYDNSGTIVSGISTDRSVIRSLQKHDFQLRYPKAMVVVSTRMGG